MSQSDQDRVRATEALAEAIHKKLLVEVTYNGKVIRLAPHQLFIRNEALFITALNPDKSRRHDEEPTLGVFKLAGLSNVDLTDQPFEPVASFDGQLPRPGDIQIAAIDAG